MSDVISPTLDELILPDTPARIKASYHTLAERASQQDFGLLEEDVVVLDTETTGLSFKNCELIEIAAARLNGRNVVDRFHTFVHPGKPIPEQIKQLTGIKKCGRYRCAYTQKSGGRISRICRRRSCSCS